MRFDNNGWTVFDSNHSGREWGYSRKKRHDTGWEIQHIKGRTECAYGPSGEFLETIQNSYFIPDQDSKKESSGK